MVATRSLFLTNWNESYSELWFDSDVTNYTLGPMGDFAFKNMCFWDYQSKYDNITFKPENFMAENCNVDEGKKLFHF